MRADSSLHEPCQTKNTNKPLRYRNIFKTDWFQVCEKPDYKSMNVRKSAQARHDELPGGMAPRQQNEAAQSTIRLPWQHHASYTEEWRRDGRWAPANAPAIAMQQQKAFTVALSSHKTAIKRSYI
jgi:hypothetical protein